MQKVDYYNTYVINGEQYIKHVDYKALHKSQQEDYEEIVKKWKVHCDEQQKIIDKQINHYADLKKKYKSLEKELADMKAERDSKQKGVTFAEPQRMF